ncbi:MAG: histidine phosphatase family protein [Planctomycetota bacterium]
MSELWLIRHGETEWSRTRRHTGRTDIALTARGVREAELVRPRLAAHTFSLVLTSPLRRARNTCVLAGYGDRALVDADLCEWDYGACEGRTTADIRAEQPGWDIWNDGAPGGETVDEVGARADRAIARVLAAMGNTALFAHAHLLRVLAARWLGLPSVSGACFALDTAAVCVLGYERERRVLLHWNDVSHLDAQSTV